MGQYTHYISQQRPHALTPSYPPLSQEVPVAIGALHHLENLNLDENSLFSVPRELGALSQLNILSLRANNLTELPSEIGGLTNLIVLNVVGNRYSVHQGLKIFYS